MAPASLPQARRPAVSRAGFVPFVSPAGASWDESGPANGRIAETPTVPALAASARPPIRPTPTPLLGRIRPGNGDRLCRRGTGFAIRDPAPPDSSHDARRGESADTLC